MNIPDDFDTPAEINIVPMIDVIFATIKKQLLDGDRVHIVGFGTLEIVERRARRGRNPATGKAIELPARQALVFRPSRALKSV